MHHFKRFAAALALAGLSSLAQATTTPLSPSGQWVTFDVDDQSANSSGVEWIDIGDGSALSFSFTINAPTWLRVVDGGYAGDRFNVTINGASFATSAVAAGSVGSTPSLGLNFDAAWANPAFSQGSWLLSTPGSYTVTGSLLQSVQFNGSALNATVGAVMLAPVPEPGTWVLMLGGLGVLGLALRRRA